MIRSNAGQYAVITGNYWAFTLTDGALRMLVVLHFHALGYSAWEIALLFVFYELFGVITNLFGGWLGARLGLNVTMNIGLALQIVALLMLCLPDSSLGVVWVMCAQALSGIAKDLNKMSAKSSVKSLMRDASGGLFRWVAVLTGSKNALKGVGFFLGAWLLWWLGFQGAMAAMAGTLALIWVASMLLLRADLGKSTAKPKFTQIFSRSDRLNRLSFARFALFGARDVWFVVGLPVYLSASGFEPVQTGTTLALWVIGYGIIQAGAPALKPENPARWAAIMCVVMAIVAVIAEQSVAALLIGLALFGAAFAVNSALHSFLVVDWAQQDGTSLDVGFYYMANAAGRLIGTLLSGALYAWQGLSACLWAAVILLALAAISSRGLARLGREPAAD